MMRLKSIKELSKLREQAHKRLIEQGKTVQVIVHLGTCGISSGANLILDAFQKEVKDHKLSNIIIRKAGCIGLCGREPVVTVTQDQNDRVIYADLTADRIPQIVEHHLVGGKVIKEWALDLDTPFFNLQEIRIMKNQDIDPMNIEDYIARDGYQALAKVLAKMNSDDEDDMFDSSKMRKKNALNLNVKKLN